MKLLLAMLVAFAFVTLAFVGSAGAQSTCGPHTGMIASLDLKYSEVRLGVGSGRTTLFEVWANAETGTWTILEVFASGMACVSAAGKNWRSGSPVAPGSPV